MDMRLFRTATSVSVAAATLVLAMAMLLGGPSSALADHGGARGGGRDGGSGARCGYDVAYGTPVPSGMAQSCWAPSTAYPGLAGWYAKVGRPGDCNYAPFAGYFWAYPSSLQCLAIPRYDAYALTNGGWSHVSVVAGTTGYVYPYTAGWRWVYVSDGWVAMQAADVGLLWKQSVQWDAATVRAMFGTGQVDDD